MRLAAVGRHAAHQGDLRWLRIDLSSSCPASTGAVQCCLILQSEASSMNVNAAAGQDGIGTEGGGQNEPTKGGMGWAAEGWQRLSKCNGSCRVALTRGYVETGRGGQLGCKNVPVVLVSSGTRRITRFPASHCLPCRQARAGWLCAQRPATAGRSAPRLSPPPPGRPPWQPQCVR